jgi:elongation factor P
VTEEVAGPRSKFIKANTVIDLMTFDEKIIGFKFPISVELKVTEAVDAVKGNTISGGNKRVTLETGAEINVPMFVNQGDVIKINTESEEYSERVGK